MATVGGIYVEVGTKRVFAGAHDWPGWCRSGRDEHAALEALVAYGTRYRRALGSAARRFTPPRDTSALDVTERLTGDATTDFGAPSVPPASDHDPVDERDLARWTALLEACWAAFDRAARAARGVELRKGPRGGGRELEAIVDHVREADRSYLSPLGGSYRSAADDGPAARMAGVRRAFVDAVRARARGEPMPSGRKAKKTWPAKYGVRRSAWHSLDHAWEIEDRSRRRAE